MYARQKKDCFCLRLKVYRLKKEDLHGRIIKIRRTEDKYRDENSKWVVAVKEHAKTDAGNRDLIISSTAPDTLNQILELYTTGTYFI